MKSLLKSSSLVVLASVGFAGAAHAEDVLNIYNWSDYIGEETIANFEKETGIKVNYDVYDSNQVVEAKLLAGNSGYDIVVPTLADAERLIKAKIFQPIDKSKLSNYGNLDPVILKQQAKYDPDNTYAVPYFWGTNGFGYNVEKVKEVLGDDAPVDSWAMIFDPKYAEPLSKCGLSLLDDPGEVVPLVNFYLGNMEDGAPSAATIESGIAQLEKIRPFVTYFHSSQYINDLANGNTCVSVGWSGDVGMAALRAEEAGNGNEIKYVIPKEGTLIWFDAMMIPEDAPNPELAHKFIDYVLRADVEADIANYVAYATPNLAAMELVDESLLADPGIYPPQEVKERLRSKVEPGSRELRTRTRLWTKLKTGQ
ncbi:MULTISPECIES: polyamine ABC transporter substrate-binding protein [Thalassospira]|uniref:Putrescine-binding periplasmic protein n=2 Tax=Thalassospira TaxID=168934 RepID=A0A367W6U7_9PROT|nr:MULTISPECIES: polyamine ABC transporter substrate-binding protein [Thalassospira]MDG4719211.1 polyamine ABC transporter substrate-binding protein [Thalassospira sp. FZY0004]RCK37133.1 spermidine/putrescine ABC transporter substrate-binding protein [Thalassospira profundimaris]